MFKQKLNNKTRLHLLLQENPDGLPIAEIADLLKLNDDKCKHLIAEEESRGMVDFKTYDSGIPLYVSKKKVSVRQESTDQYFILKTLFIVFGVIILIFSGLILSELFDEFKNGQTSVASTYINLPKPVQHKTTEKNYLNYKQQKNDVYLSEYVVANIAKKQISEYQTQKRDLEKRVELMEAQKYSCYQDWFTNQPCYITNRLLNKEEFERELAEINLEISKLSELISLYKK
ncbi:MAG: hypothetical protein ABEI32_13815 [Halothece sp.]